VIRFQFKKNVGHKDSALRIMAGFTLIVLYALRVFPGNGLINALAGLFGAFLVLEGSTHY
jgi:hypothetical protein